MKKLTLEYIAGFVDGEGTFMIGKRTCIGYQPRFSVSNTNKQILEDIKKFVSITTKVYPNRRKDHRFKTTYTLEVDAIDECKSIARLLEPHLRLKKKHAQIILQYPRARRIYIGGVLHEDISTKACVIKLRKRIRLLNKTGPTTKEVI